MRLHLVENGKAVSTVELGAGKTVTALAFVSAAGQFAVLLFGTSLHLYDVGAKLERAADVSLGPRAASRLTLSALGDRITCSRTQRCASEVDAPYCSRSCSP